MSDSTPSYENINDEFYRAKYGDFERSYISKVENVERTIQVNTLIRFAKALQMKLSDLVIELEKRISF